MYEMIFQYNDSTTNDLLREEMIKKFGTPNAAEEDMPYQWSATVSENLKLLFWVYQNKFCIADASKF